MNKSIVEEASLDMQLNREDEIDLRELFGALWQGKWIIVFTTFLLSISGVFYALSQPNTYQSAAVLVSAQDDGGGLSSMASQLGGLASLAGIGVGSGGADSKTIALSVLKSRLFLNHFISSHQLLPELFAVKEWDIETGAPQFDPEIYDAANSLWLSNSETGETLQPSDWDAHKLLSGLVKVSEAKDTSLVTLSITHVSPHFAQRLVDLLVKDLNEWMKLEALEDSRTNIAYLQQQLERTNVVDMQNVFYQLIEEQTKTLMLAEVKDEFAFKTVDPAVVPEEKVGPKRALICILAAMLGGMLGIAIVLIRFAFKK
ncbi:Wzz/FepE/Etk N-terminal domain-containing protein [Vibrio intestinalis]|uniref:Wzz/FepE/Etk N-terminal domain-containing protein n=1 Tax=Vibrio intestinalis TaxID=2933291 RepID=UPI0021A424E1|nr:Wzz/FepE/Etk N-terminal domain-containing protein [Vibrio intestinalis]